jgi:nucleoside-diphosphate-sugar epimerase
MIELVPYVDETAHIPAPTPLNYVSDLSRIGIELGWRPEISVEEGLRSLL